MSRSGPRAVGKPLIAQSVKNLPAVQKIWVQFLCIHGIIYACRLSQLYPTLCDPMDSSPPDSSVHGIFQAGILECVDISSSRGSSQAGDQTHISFISCIGWWILYWWATWEAQDSLGSLKMPMPGRLMNQWSQNLWWVGPGISILKFPR